MRPSSKWIELEKSLMAQQIKNLLAMQETQEMWVQSLGWEGVPGGGNATHSSILAWEIPWTEEPGGLQSKESQRVQHDWAWPWTDGEKSKDKTQGHSNIKIREKRTSEQDRPRSDNEAEENMECVSWKSQEGRVSQWIKCCCPVKKDKDWDEMWPEDSALLEVVIEDLEQFQWISEGETMIGVSSRQKGEEKLGTTFFSRRFTPKRDLRD